MTDTLIIVSSESSSKRRLRQLAEWSSHGFELIADIHERDDAISMIISRSPSLVILDGTLPLSELCDIMKITRSRDYHGHFFIISSKSDFKVAQAGLRHGAERYIVTPVNSAELALELRSLRERIAAKNAADASLRFYRTSASGEILRDALLSGKTPSESVIDELGFSADLYQAAIFENLAPDSSAAYSTFSDFIRNSGVDRISFSSIHSSGSEIVLVKGALSIGILRELLYDYSSRGSNKTGFFISLGNAVSSFSSVNISYSQARYASDRKFLTPKGTVYLSFESLSAARHEALSSAQTSFFCRQFLDGLQTFKRHNVTDVTESLREYLSSTQAPSADVRLFLSDLFLQIKESFLRLYSTANIPFASNSEILDLISRKVFLHEVLNFYSEQFDLIMSNIGGTSRDSVLDDVFYYIAHNYNSPIKLESLASLFGYNSAYLGKIFHRAAGMSFNSYIDKLRVEHSIKLLRESDMKVYEIARNVGYRSVDYYHKKFRTLTGESPAEYRKRILSSDE